MRIFQRGVLPPVQFTELDASMRSSVLGPANSGASVDAEDILDSATRRLGYVDYSGGPDMIIRSFNITGVTKTGTGRYSIDVTAAGFTEAPIVALGGTGTFDFVRLGIVTATTVAINYDDDQLNPIDGRFSAIIIGI